MPRVSAIIPTYNRADLLERALRSVAAQDYRPIEAIVIDDGSTDHTPRILAEQAKSLADSGIELKTHHQQNQRAPKARNVGMKLAAGELFAFLDSDDLWYPGYVSTLVRLLDEHPSAGLAFCQIVVIDPDDKVVKNRDTQLPPEPREGVLRRPFEQIVRYMPMQTSGVVVRRSVIESVGDFDLDLPVVEDWDLWYRISKRYDFAFTLEGLACNREHPSNLPKFNLLALRGNLRMNIRHLRDVKDPTSRRILEDRIRWHILLLQEELLRQRHSGDGYHELLRHELRPRSLRWKLGSIMRGMPGRVGQAYAGAIRWLGQRKRSR